MLLIFLRILKLISPFAFSLLHVSFIHFFVCFLFNITTSALFSFSSQQPVFVDFKNTKTENKIQFRASWQFGLPTNESEWDKKEEKKLRTLLEYHLHTWGKRSTYTTFIYLHVVFKIRHVHSSSQRNGQKSFFSAGVSNYDREKLMIVDFINLFKFHFPPQEELQYKFEECERRRHMEQRRKEEDKKSGAREVSKTIYGEVEKQHKKKNCCVCDLVSRVQLWPWNLLENFNLLVNELKRSFS